MITPIGEVPGLDVIVAGPVPPNPAELLMSRKGRPALQNPAWHVRLYHCGYRPDWSCK